MAATTDDWEILAGQHNLDLDLDTIIFFLRKTASEPEALAAGEQTNAVRYLAADDASGLTVAWIDIRVAAAMQMAYGGEIVPFVLGEALERAAAAGVSFVVRAPEGDVEFCPTTGSGTTLH